MQDHVNLIPLAVDWNRKAVSYHMQKLSRLKIIVMPPERLLAVMHREMKLNKLV